MARPRTISNEQILNAAREVFLESGPEATTAEIASRAGVSEGTIFRRFSTKQELFITCILGFDQEENPLGAIAAAREIEDPVEALTLLSGRLIDFFSKLLPRASLLMSSVMAKGAQGFASAQAPPVLGLKGLSALFDEWQRRGVIRACDPEIAARMLLGSMMQYVFGELSGVNQFLPMPRQTYIRGVVDTLLGGLKPQEP